MALASADDLFARAAEIAAHAVDVARGRRRHAPLVFYWLPDGELALEPLQGRLESVERAWAKVAREVIARAAHGLIFVGEGWTELADDDHDLTEALIISAVARTGEERTWAAPVTRGRLRVTSVGDLVTSATHRPSFLAPVRAAWGIVVEG